MYQLCGAPSLHVLGTINPNDPPRDFDPNHLLAYTASSGLLPTVFCPRACSISVQVIMFDRPSPYRMQYMSLEPIPLMLGDKPLIKSSSPPRVNRLDSEHGNGEKRHLAEKLRLHTVVQRCPSRKEASLANILSQINCSSELAQLIMENSHHLGVRPKRSLSVGEQVVVSATTLKDWVWATAQHIGTVWIWPFVVMLVILLMMCHRIVGEVILRVMEWRPHPDSAALKDISATAQQIDIRLQQFCYWPIQNYTLRKRKKDWASITQSHPDYIRFYNSLWLVANDVIIGIALGTYIIDNASWVAWQINTVLNDWTVEGLRDMIQWLMDWPAGLKLNTELAKFLGDLFLWVIQRWEGAYYFEV